MHWIWQHSALLVLLITFHKIKCKTCIIFVFSQKHDVYSDFIRVYFLNFYDQNLTKNSDVTVSMADRSYKYRLEGLLGWVPNNKVVCWKRWVSVSSGKFGSVINVWRPGKITIFTFICLILQPWCTKKKKTATYQASAIINKTLFCSGHFFFVMAETD